MANGSMTANGHNSEANGVNAGKVKGNYVDAIVSGTFVATVQLQTKDAAGNWVPWGANITAPDARFVEAAQPDREWRLAVTAFTSGTIVYDLSAQRDRSRQSQF